MTLNNIHELAQQLEKDHKIFLDEIKVFSITQQTKIAVWKASNNLNYENLAIAIIKKKESDPSV